MTAKLFRLILALCACCLVFTPWARGQSTGGSISGVVKDQTGPVQSARVDVVNNSTNQARSASTDESGRYVISEVPPGSYTLRVIASGYNTVEVGARPNPPIQVSVAQVARLEDILLSPATVTATVEVKAADVAMTDAATPTLSTSFSERQIRELPILTRDVNNLALQAPGVFSVRTFSFASTLVPFAVNGSRGRDNNFIIDSVDNNEPLFGGAATQFTNTDLFAEYRILTNQYQAEYGRNSGSVVNIITRQGGNQWRGSGFWFGQSNRLNALTSVEKQAGLTRPARYYENQAGATLGGPLKKNSSWAFLSYQWDRARNDLSPVYPVVATLPTTAGLTTLRRLNPAANSPLAALLADPTVKTLPGLTTPCGAAGSGLPKNNPCTIGSVMVDEDRTAEFGTFLVPQASVFDVRDHQLSGRWDQKITQGNTIYVRYLFDDLRTPRIALAAPSEIAFAEFGLLPQWREIFAQRTQNVGAFWTYAFPSGNKLNEVRISYSRIASQDGALDASPPQSNLPALTVFDCFRPRNTCSADPENPPSQKLLNFLGDFPAAGRTITTGRDSRPTRVRSNLYQVQENFSITAPRHRVKFGVNVVRTQSDIVQIAADLGHYFYNSFADFVNNRPAAAFQRFGNLGGAGGEGLPLRETAQFYFVQDDIRVSSNFTLNLGLRYENYGQAFNRIAELNPTAAKLGSIPMLGRANKHFAPRVGFALGIRNNTVLRGGYGIYYNPTFFNIALLAWQSGPVSPFVKGSPPNRFPKLPFSASSAAGAVTDCNFLNPPPESSPTGSTNFVNCTLQNTVSPDLANPYVHSWSLSLQQQVGRDFMLEASYVGSRGTRLFQRLDLNPNQGWTCDPEAGRGCTLNGRLVPARGDIAEVTNGATSDYHALQVSATKRLRRTGFWDGLAITAAYAYSHMTDNASEIFGPGSVFASPTGDVLNVANGFQPGAAVEVITPFPQNSKNPVQGEHGNSTFDRRHRGSVSFLWALPSPSSTAGRAVFGNWELNGLMTVQSGQPFTPLNGFRTCLDAGGDGILTNDRPSIGNPAAPLNTVALLADPNCANPSKGYVLPDGKTPVDPATVHFVQFPKGVAPGQTFSVTVNEKTERFVAGNAGRNILVGPQTVNFDFAVLKNFPFAEHFNLQFRAEFYDVFNHANPGSPFGNVFTANAQLTPAFAFSPTKTPARVTGATPENAIDAIDPNAKTSLFLSQRFMNTGNRRIQFGLRFIF